MDEKWGREGRKERGGRRDCWGAKWGIEMGGIRREGEGCEGCGWMGERKRGRVIGEGWRWRGEGWRVRDCIGITTPATPPSPPLLSIAWGEKQLCVLCFVYFDQSRSYIIWRFLCFYFYLFIYFILFYFILFLFIYFILFIYLLFLYRCAPRVPAGGQWGQPAGDAGLHNSQSGAG